MSQTLTEPLTPPKPEPEEKEERSSERDYFVFVEGPGDTWKKLTTVTASSAEGAIKSIQDAKEGARYAAVPVRNWSVGKPKIKVVTQVSIEFE